MSTEVHGTVVKIFLQGCQKWKKCPEEQIKENPFPKRKNSTNFFKDSEPTLYFTLSEKIARVVKTVTYVALEDFEEKNV